jgi:hypothetical protein
MDQALLGLVQSGEIDPNEAFLRATDKKEFILHVTRTDLLTIVDQGPTGTSQGGSGCQPESTPS